jgi:hypothetical protein
MVHKRFIVLRTIRAGTSPAPTIEQIESANSNTEVPINLQLGIGALSL